MNTEQKIRECAKQMELVFNIPEFEAISFLTRQFGQAEPAHIKSWWRKRTPDEEERLRRLLEEQSTASNLPQPDKWKCPNCGSDKGTWFSRTEPMGNFCESCGKCCDEQPDKSLDEIVEKWLRYDHTPERATRRARIRNACLEYAATREKNAKKLCNNLAGVLNAADGDDLIAIVETIIKQRDDAMANQDEYHYFKAHEVGRPLPIDTEILLDDGRWVEACSWPQYDATKNYQARTKEAVYPGYDKTAAQMNGAK